MGHKETLGDTNCIIEGYLFGAGGRTRTGTMSPSVDFESTTSTNSITPAGTNTVYTNFSENASIICRKEVLF